MPQVQQVRKFHLLAKELDHDDGEVTATMKVRRKSIAEKYGDVIESHLCLKPPRASLLEQPEARHRRLCASTGPDISMP